MSFLCQKNNVNIKFITQIIYLRSSILLKYKTNVISVPEIKLGINIFRGIKHLKIKFYPCYLLLPHIYLFLSLSRTDNFKRTSKLSLVTNILRSNPSKLSL